MSFDDSFSKRVAMARNSLGLTQSELAKKVGVVPRQIAAYEGGEAKPREKALQNLAAALGATIEWLTHGKGSGPDVSSVKRTVTVREIPVLDHMQINIEHGKNFMDEANIIDFIPSLPTSGENAFAVKIEGSSMVSTYGISFPPDSIVTFDPDLQARNGDFVLCAMFDERLLTFKKLINDQGRLLLVSLNPAFPPIQTENCEIIGVAIHSQLFIKRNQNEFENEWRDVDSWRDAAPFESDQSLSTRIEGVEKKLDSLFDLLANKKPT